MIFDTPTINQILPCPSLPTFDHFGADFVSRLLSGFIFPVNVITVKMVTSCPQAPA
jgi:hypothetical protein